MPAEDVVLTAIWEPLPVIAEDDEEGSDAEARGRAGDGDSAEEGGNSEEAGSTEESASTEEAGTSEVSNETKVDDIVLATVVGSESSGTSDPVSEESVVLTQAELASRAQEEGIPVANILGTGIPLVTSSDLAAWSLFNIIITILLACLFFIGLLRLALLRKKLNKETGQVTSASKNSSTTGELSVVMLEFVAAMAAVLVILVTQDVSNPMTFFDSWSPLFATAVTLVLVYVIHNNLRGSAKSSVEFAMTQSAQE
jgi:hypothetical protein